MRSVLVSIVLLLMSGFLSAQPAEKKSAPVAAPAKPVAALAWLVGGVWTADASKMGSGMQRIETRYEWSDNGAYLHFTTHFVSDNGTLKAENVLFDRLWQHQDLDVGVIPMRSVTNQGLLDHQGKKVFLVRARSRSGPLRTAEHRLRLHLAPVSAPGPKQEFKLANYRLARSLRAAYTCRLALGCCRKRRLRSNP